MGRHHKLTLDCLVHDANASSARKLRMITKKHGNDGYAAFFRLLEMLCREDGIMLKVDNDYEAELIAEDCSLRDSAHLYNILHDCTEIGLFDKQLWESERTIFSHGLFRRYEKRLKDRRAAAERMQNTREQKALEVKLEEIRNCSPEQNNCSHEQNNCSPNKVTDKEIQDCSPEQNNCSANKVTDEEIRDCSPEQNNCSHEQNNCSPNKVTDTDTNTNTESKSKTNSESERERKKISHANESFL